MRILLQYFVSCCVFLCLAFGVYGQAYKVEGYVLDMDSAALPGSTILLTRSGDAIQSGVFSDSTGKFVFDKLDSGTYVLKVSFLGFQTIERNVIVQQSVHLGKIYLKSSSQTLDEVKVIDKAPTVQQKGDTTEINAKPFVTNPDANIEDLVRKMPGIDVNTNTNTVKAHGEVVGKILVDGKPFWGDDPAAVLKNLPAEVVDKIQIFDQKTEQDQFTGFSTGQKVKTINIVTRPDKRKGKFGKAYAGYGTDSKYQAGFHLNKFNEGQKISVMAQSNNINIQNFSSPGNSTSSSQPGISTVNAAGFNYNDKWGKNTDVSASYFFNKNNSEINRTTLRNYILPGDSNQTYRQANANKTESYNHRANLRIDYKIDTSNSLLLRPSLSLQQSDNSSTMAAETYNDQTFLNQTINNNQSAVLGYSLANEALFRHKFKKIRRTFSLSWNMGYNYSNGTNGLLAKDNLKDSTTIDQHSDQLTTGWSSSANAAYTEPLGKNSALQLNYTLGFQGNKSEKKTYNYSDVTNAYDNVDSLLSNSFESNIRSQNYGLSYLLNYTKLNVTAGASYQWLEMENKQILPKGNDFERTYNNILPSATLNYKFSTGKNLNLTYRSSTNQPSVTQLQNVVNNTNPVQLTTGNPQLKQAYQHTVFIRYGLSNKEKSNSLFFNISGTYTNNYIANSTSIASEDVLFDGNVILKKGGQLIRPVNMDGAFNLSSSVTYGVPLSVIKSNLNTSFMYNYARNPGLINEEINYSNSHTPGVTLSLNSNISEAIDFNISSTSSYTFTKNVLQPNLNSSYFSQNNYVKLYWKFWKNFVYQTDLNQQLYSGLSSNYNTNYILWNMALAKKFLKNNRGELKLSVYDLLKQNTSIQRNITAVYYEDVRTQVLQRYVMLTFTYTLRNFRGKK